MKILKNISYLALVLVTFTSCELADPIESEITEYAEFEVVDGPYVYIPVGTAYEEPGVIAMAGEDELEVTISGSVDTDTPGVYVLNYTAVNADGFPATTTRYVAVGNQEVAFGRDLSGVYSVGTSSNTITQIQPGFYLNSDTLPPNGIDVIMVDLGNGNLVIPPQSSPFGQVFADPSINADSSVTLSADENTIVIKQSIGSFGIFTRTFVKQ